MIALVITFIQSSNYHKAPMYQGSVTRPGLILFVNHDYFYLIEIFFNQKLFCNRRFLRLKLFLFLFDYFSKLLVIVINLTNKL